MLQISVALIIAVTMALSLLVVRDRMRTDVQRSLHDDLQHSLQTFQDLQERRRSALERENTLLATLPTLRALMTTHDERTIQDSAQDFWKLSGNELFALADSEGRVIAAYAKGATNAADLRQQLQAAMSQSAKHYLLASGNLYEYTYTPIYFGTATNGTLLGYVVGGYSVDHELLREVGRGAGAEGIFLAGNRVAATTLPIDVSAGVIESASSAEDASPRALRLGAGRFLTVSRDLTRSANVPLHLIVLKSFDTAEQAEREISRVLLLAAVFAIAIGSVLMLVLARTLTKPLERLAAAVSAFANGDEAYALPADGPREVRYLSEVIAGMRADIQKKNRALLESERLATIGRMAHSVSHDLRHYLAAVYANAEFLASPSLPESERLEVFEEIRVAVLGTTDMLDTLLLFSTTGSTPPRHAVPMNTVVDRAIALIHAHPDAERVTVRADYADDDTNAIIDARQMERAVYNLLLNACQSAGQSNGRREVLVSVSVNEKHIAITVQDTGPGVPEIIRHTLFDAFVSNGKQKGTGLGLTLTHSVAQDHNGSVELVSSEPGATVFRLTIERKCPPGEATKPSTNASLVTP
ncbi:ATP-binding protein [Terriglobus roseus]|uniref:histidine kinase n=1 Tax=Terriglobus roseus TaxID=392734 RepID=A0A1H4NUP4_9BACT|nr:ATP-binding protein [Terriglobus roseus]SEB98947.1 Signal transduction histidine kinase [Terriglobus roseus]